jgi:hypothetical protein
MSLVTQAGDLLLSKSYWEGTTIKAVLLKPTYTPNRDHKFASDFATHEATGTGYTGGFGGGGRKSLAGKSATSDDPNNRNIFVATPPSWTGINVGEVAYIALIQEITNDAASPLLVVLDAPTNRVTDGGDLLPEWPGNILFDRTT